MTEAAIIYPSWLDPVLVEIGPLVIRWYALAYIAGLLFGWWYVRRLLTTDRLWARSGLASLPPFTWHGRFDEAARARHAVTPPARPADLDDLLVWLTFGVILGGRLGYVLIYGVAYCGLLEPGARMCTDGRLPEIFLENPLKIIAIWEGGMSFHGGLAGVVLALLLFSMRRGLDPVRIGDLVACATPVGLFFGRIANFINVEIYGKVADLPWAVVFCNDKIAARHGGGCPAGLLPRHPSQIYEALTEGALLFAVLFVLAHRTTMLRRPGLAIGVFLVGYGLARSFSDLFKESSAMLWGPVTMGMVLSLPMWAAGAFFLWYAAKARGKAALRPSAPGGG